MKKRYLLYGFLILLIAFVAYNYYAAADAEEEFTKAIQEQVDAPRESISIQYSSIDISPFQGNIRFEDINIIQPETIKRAESLVLDLSYWGFLTFNFGGVEFGLKHLSEALLMLDEPVRINRKSLAEISFDDLFIEYKGTLWDAVQAYFTPKPPTEIHTLTIVGEEGVYWKPKSTVGSFRIDSLYVNHTFAVKKAVASEPLNTIQFYGITWSTPEAFQQKYAFFIQGFGLEADSVTFDEADMAYTVTEKRIKIVEGTIEMNLFEARFHGFIDKQPIPAFSPLYITIADLSPTLMAFLQNLKQLFGLPIPVNNSAFHFRLVGPVADPQIVFDENL